LDIAGVAWSQEDKLLSPKGVTGFGVKLLVDWILTTDEL
jgi:leucyl aminopeptidase